MSLTALGQFIDLVGTTASPSTVTTALTGNSGTIAVTEVTKPIVVGPGTGVDFRIVYAAGAADTSFTVEVATSKDGSVFFRCPEYSFTQATPVSGTYEIKVRDLASFESHVRIRCSATSGSTPDGTVNIKGRIFGKKKAFTT